MIKQKIGLYTATSIVVANMVGTGVFTSLGFQAAGLHSGFTIMLLWIIGGIVAFTGALCYGELGSMFPQSGGEYNYLSKIYHPALGFAAGWVSVTVGFAAPVAAAAMALGAYAHSAFSFIHPLFLAASVVVIISLIHSLSIKSGSTFQNYTTSIKVVAILIIICFGLFNQHSGDIKFEYSSMVRDEVLSSSFATSFFFVSLAYSGWNAAGYIASDMETPQQNLPKSLLYGTLLVTILYMALNFIFMYVTPIAAMSNESGPIVDIAGVAANYIFGSAGGKIMSSIIALLLISTISAMIIAGPRVTQSMGKDHSIFRLFSKINNNGVPAIAIITQGVISLLFIFSSSFSEVVIYISFTLNLFTFLAVAGIIVMRIKHPNMERPYQTWGYPIVPLLFLFITGYLMYFGLVSNLKESILGLLTAFSGIALYFATQKQK
ncbi:MAG TPA: amino acid permease [Bacteroidia bacterium]|nr:amino acid permease [Bacteroidia bacterium]